MYMSESSPESNAAWDNLMPSGRGFVLVEDPKSYGLGPGIPTDTEVDRYSISMFHQLHCLGMVREMYFASVHGSKANVFGEEELSGTELKHQQMIHIGHCFDYLRQAIMCAGDMTLEGAMLLPNGEVGPAGVDGWGATHQCRSWEQAVEWTIEHKAPHNHTGIA
ncbi:Oxidase ustYa [Paramyrothecium foliicola]|nr:Oxidase ustYa [Paramyrothecium foliicola]